MATRRELALARDHLLRAHPVLVHDDEVDGVTAAAAATSDVAAAPTTVHVNEPELKKMKEQSRFRCLFKKNTSSDVLLLF